MSVAKYTLAIAGDLKEHGFARVFPPVRGVEDFATRRRIENQYRSRLSNAAYRAGGRIRT